MLSNDPRVRSFNPANPKTDELADSPAVPRVIPDPAVAMQVHPAVTEPIGPMKFAPAAAVPERMPALAENPVVTEHRDTHQIPQQK